MLKKFLLIALLALPTSAMFAQSAEVAEKYPAPPKDYDKKRDGIEHGP